MKRFILLAALWAAAYATNAQGKTDTWLELLVRTQASFFVKIF